MTSPFYPVGTKENDRYFKEPLKQTIHGQRSLTEDGGCNVKLVAVGGGHQKKQRLLKFPATANRSE